MKNVYIVLTRKDETSAWEVDKVFASGSAAALYAHDLLELGHLSENVDTQDWEVEE